MKLAVVGSRGIELDVERMGKYIPSEVDVIISGGAKGIDARAAIYAKEKDVKLIEIKPDYKRYGKAAPIIRNREIIQMADRVLVLWDGKSKGSKFVIEECKKTGKEYQVFVL